MVFEMVFPLVIEERAKRLLEPLLDRLSIVFIQKPEGFQPVPLYAERVQGYEAFAFILWCRKQLEDRGWGIRKRNKSTLLKLLFKARKEGGERFTR